jgi:hypothetical protein
MISTFLALSLFSAANAQYGDVAWPAYEACMAEIRVVPAPDIDIEDGEEAMLDAAEQYLEDLAPSRETIRRCIALNKRGQQFYEDRREDYLEMLAEVEPDSVAYQGLEAAVKYWEMRRCELISDYIFLVLADSQASILSVSTIKYDLLHEDDASD